MCINPYHYESNREMSDDDRRIRFERTGQKRARRESQDSTDGDNGYLSSDVLMIEHTRDRSQSPSQGYGRESPDKPNGQLQYVLIPSENSPTRFDLDGGKFTVK